MDQSCTAQVFSNDVPLYTFTGPGTKPFKQGVYTVYVMCPTGTHRFSNVIMGTSPVELATGPGADVNALDTVLTHGHPE